MVFIGFWKWGFRSTLKVHSSRKDSPKVNESLTFADLVRDKLPILDTNRKLWLNPLLFNGALQTLYYGMDKAENKFQVFYGRELFEYSDKGVCSLDWAIEEPDSMEEFNKLYKETLPASSPRLHPRTRFFSKQELEIRLKSTEEHSERPLCVAFHGLAGGSHEPLIRNLAQELRQHSTHKWDFVVVNSRGCCRTKITTGKLFNALSYEDLGEVLEELRRRYPQRSIYAVGFSFGAVQLANFLAQVGDSARDLIKAAFLVGCPWDMIGSAMHIPKSLTGRFLINPNLTMFLNKLVKSNYNELTLHGSEVFNEKNIKSARMAKTTFEWDDALTCKTAGFKNSWDYYEKASPLSRVEQIKIPTFSLNANDDPTVDNGFDLDDVTKRNSNVIMAETDLGGHLGWVQYSGEYWSVKVACEFFDAFETYSTK